VAAVNPLKKSPLLYELPICNNPQHQKLKQQILRQGKDLVKAESAAENLSTALARLSLKAEKATKRASILAGQLKKISLSLIMAKEKEATMAPRIRYTIYRLITPRVQD
jgi:hypothetical protein